MLIAVVPSGGMAQSTGAPVASGSAATVYNVQAGGGAVSVVGSFTIYNISTTESVAAGALAVLQPAEGGHYYAAAWSGQANAPPVHGYLNPGHRNF